MNLLLRLTSPRALAVGLLAWMVTATLTAPKPKTKPARPAPDEEAPLGI